MLKNFLYIVLYIKNSFFREGRGGLDDWKISCPPSSKNIYSCTELSHTPTCLPPSGQLVSSLHLILFFNVRSMVDERRSRYRDSPTGSTSSRDSFEDKTDVYRPNERSSSLHRKGSRNKTSQASLKALEEELLKISPHPTRKKKQSVVKRVSSSSEGSIEDFSLKLSPSNNRRASNEASSSHALSQSHDKLYGWDNLDIRKKQQAGSPVTSTKGEMRFVALPIPTEDNLDVVDGPPESPYAGEHRPSLITALSQIKVRHCE